MGVQSRNVLGHGEGRAKANQAKHSDKTFAHLQVTSKCMEKLLRAALPLEDIPLKLIMPFNFDNEKSCLTIFAVNPLQGVMRNLLVEGCKETVGLHKYRLWFYMSCDSAGARHCWPYLPDDTVTHTKGNTDFGDRV